jgi:ketosteroid isomerase-like protein
MPGMRPDDDAAEVEEANARFYRALESHDLAEMDRLWAHGEGVRCIHPGWTLLSGWDTVRQSWEAIFKDQREMRFSIGEVDVHVEADLAWVTCTESILSQAQGNIAVTTLLATNVFERRGGEWLMVHHHASHILAGGPPPES